MLKYKSLQSSAKGMISMHMQKYIFSKTTQLQVQSHISTIKKALAIKVTSALFVEKMPFEHRRMNALQALAEMCETFKGKTCD